MRNLPFMPKIPFHTLFRGANPDALHLLDMCLAFDPANRVGVEEALGHPYLSVWHDPSDEPTCPAKFDFTFEVVEDTAQMKQMILEEVRRFREHVRRRPDSQIQQLGVPQGALPQGQNGVPIPEGQPMVNEDPRPEEADGQGNNLEQDLARGLDVMR